jgi:multicomponent Na+:H+ antiporter subunit C
MVPETVLLIGVMTGTGVYLFLQSGFVRILFGFILLSNAANLFLLAMSGSPFGKQAPVVLDESVGGSLPSVDPLPQALILTAIVIGFGLTAYLIVLLYRLFLDQGTMNSRAMHEEKDGPGGTS